MQTRRLARDFGKLKLAPIGSETIYILAAGAAGRPKLASGGAAGQARSSLKGRLGQSNPINRNGRLA